MRADYLHEAEKQIISGIIVFGLNDEYCRYALDNLTADDFLIESHKDIFNYFQSIIAEEKEIDLVELLKSTLISDEQFTDLCNCCMTVANFKSYVSMLKKRTSDNRIISGVTSISNAPDKFNALEKLYISEKELREKENKTAHQKDAQQYLDFITHINEPIDESERIKTGFGTIDKYIGGFRKKSISVIGAYPSTGKTTFALNIARYQIERKTQTLFVSLEMSCNQIYERLVSDVLSINYLRVGCKDISDREKGQISVLLNQLSKANVLHIRDDVLFLEDISKEISLLRPDLVIIDFIQRIKTHYRANSRREEIDYISAEIKRLAMVYNCHIMTLSQLARKADGHKPTMADLKESGSLEQDNDYIMLLYRPNVSDKTKDFSETHFVIDKNKYGQTGQKEMHFNGGFQRFTEVIDV